ncbi:MAG: hypothetical protein M3384_09740 [Acidobacteriota bacterium]|nr:hypothetical protein [Acidobacteriota bacterium]
MKKFTNPLDNIRIASPCPANWDEMRGDERTRFCSQCSLNVYNLSGMTLDEAENLLLTSEGRACVRFYRRADGTILTKDCPVGWRAVKRRISRAATALVSLCAGIFAGIFAFNQPPRAREISIDPQAIPVQALAPPKGVGYKNDDDAAAEIPLSNPAHGSWEKPGTAGDFDSPAGVGMVGNLEEVKKAVRKKRKR